MPYERMLGFYFYLTIVIFTRSSQISANLYFCHPVLQAKGRPYINGNLHLARKHTRVFVRGQYLFREANSFPRAMLEENCELRGTDGVQGEISYHIFTPTRGYCVIILQIFFAKRGV